MEDDINILANRRWHQSRKTNWYLFFNWKTNSILVCKEDYLNFLLDKAGLASPSLSRAWHSSAPACFIQLLRKFQCWLLMRQLGLRLSYQDYTFFDKDRQSWLNFSLTFGSFPGVCGLIKCISTWLITQFVNVNLCLHCKWIVRKIHLYSERNSQNAFYYRVIKYFANIFWILHTQKL